jgi:plasmid maintenance system antidote protein VapI
LWHSGIAICGTKRYCSGTVATANVSETHTTGADALRELMERNERSSGWLAKRLDCSQSHAWKLIVGQRAITSATAEKLAEIFAVPATTFAQPEGTDA